MKVLQINSVCGIGSTGRIATDIHNILIEQGHKSYIAYGRDLPKNCDNTIKIGTRFDNYTHVAKTRILDKHGFGSKKATLDFIDEVKELNPDIIHLHNIHGYYINIEILFNYLKEANKPVIWTLHDCWSFTGNCSHFDYIGCEKWQTGCFDCPQKKEYPKSLIIDNSEENYLMKKNLFTGVKDLTIISPSEWLEGLVTKSFLKDYFVQVIYNGINLDVFRPIKNDFREKYGIENKFLILAVANTWTEKKGLEYLVKLSKQLNQDEVLVIVGITENQKKLFPKTIISINKTNEIEELAEIYSASDIFINPTLQEVLGLTNIEALACGTPCISFDTGGCKEIINNNGGIIIPKGDFSRLREEINNFKHHKYKHNKEDLREISIRQFDNSDMCLNYIKIYKKVVMK